MINVFNLITLTLENTVSLIEKKAETANSITINKIVYGDISVILSKYMAE
jgi:hypothetical protein